LGRLVVTYSEQSINRINMPDWDESLAVIYDMSGYASSRGASWRDLYNDLGQASRDFRGNNLFEPLFEEMQWMLGNWFWLD